MNMMQIAERMSRGWRMLFISVAIMALAGCGGQPKPEPQPKPEAVIPPDNFIGLQKVIDHPSDDKYPEVSPNGSLVAYSAKKNDNYDIFYFDPFQKKIITTQATRHVSDDTDPAWGIDSKELYFTSSRLKALSIWKIKVQSGRGVRQISVREGIHDAEPHISPDGTKLVFSSRKGKKSKRETPTLWTANIDGSMMTQIGAGHNPRWSPDGSKILFHAPAGNNFDIWMINPDGTDLMQLTTDSADDVDACWSPDGTKIVFSSNREGTIETKPNFDIWLLDLQGTGITQLTYDLGDDGAPVWSRLDRIYFHSNRDGNYDIFRGTPIIPWEN